jgi:uncharacterized tellurite resistance protein B-like protein|nr:TerB family tellurite resistance protein [Kofleriaceae bacterium]
MALPDRIEPLCDLLMGAAYADNELVDRERDEVRAMLEDLGGPLSDALAKRIADFNPKTFDVAKAAAPFRDDSDDDRKRLLFLVSAIHEADDEIDFAEDDYLRALAKALGLPDSALAGLTVDIESDDLQETFEQVRKGPPTPPPAKKK